MPSVIELQDSMKDRIFLFSILANMISASSRIGNSLEHVYTIMANADMCPLSCYYVDMTLSA